MHSHTAGCSSKAPFIYPSSGPLHAGEKNVVPGRDNCNITHCSQLQQAQGSPEWFPFKNVSAEREGIFKAEFLCHGVSEGSIHPSLFHRGGEC